MKKFLPYIFLVLFSLICFSKPVAADIPNPNYFTAKCNSDEIEIECSWSRASLNSPINDSCNRYKKNPNYRFLEGTGSTLGGSQKFCFKAISPSEFIGYHTKILLPPVLITLLLELPLFLIMISRNRKALFAVITANLISVSLFYLATVFFPFTGFPILLVLELIVIIFEAIFIKYLLKELRFRRILIYSFIANTISAIFGTVILNFINEIMNV